ncbi:MAG: c-type cytochrome [Actinobacteria bacterium]|nr:c-type cytochrome [Actinomycetota bacterium]
MRYPSLVTGACAAAAIFAFTGCGTGGYSDDGNQSAGKDLFLAANCGACHTLADAGTAGQIGPNLDDAFAQARADGMSESTFVNVTRDQILFPITDPSTEQVGMPGPGQTLPECGGDDAAGAGDFCVEDQEQAASDIAAYVGRVAGTGASATPDKPMDGKSIFAASCGSCHTLADAGTTGNVGPNLDEAKPPKSLVIDRVTNGQGAMPSFKDSLNGAQIEAVAEYVSAAGR